MTKGVEVARAGPTDFTLKVEGSTLVVYPMSFEEAEMLRYDLTALLADPSVLEHKRLDFANRKARAQNELEAATKAQDEFHTRYLNPKKGGA